MTVAFQVSFSNSLPLKFTPAVFQHPSPPLKIKISVNLWQNY